MSIRRKRQEKIIWILRIVLTCNTAVLTMGRDGKQTTQDEEPGDGRRQGDRDCTQARRTDDAPRPGHAEYRSGLRRCARGADRRRGLYDTIICRYPLPGELPAFIEAGHRFQTKDLAYRLATYEITAEGRVLQTHPGAWGDPEPNWRPSDTHHHGTLDFYTGNTAASGPGGIYTRDGSDSEFVEYRATFDRGQLVSIVETERTREPALPIARKMERERTQIPTTDDIATFEARQAESLVGRTMFFRYGSWDDSRPGDPVVVVAEGPKEWCVKLPDGGLKIIDRRSRDRLLWDSQEDERAAKKDRDDAYSAERAEYDAMVRARGLEEN